MTEKLAFDVVRRFRDFELRSYPEHVLIQVDVDGDFERAGMLGFRPLIRYISGDNVDGKQIPMTAPVVQHPLTSTRHTVSFVMPNGVDLDSSPRPANSIVRRTVVPRHTVAARSFRGTWSEDHFAKERDALISAVDREGIATVGTPYFARFDPPWMPSFLRHNEVLLDTVSSPS